MVVQLAQNADILTQSPVPVLNPSTESFKPLPELDPRCYPIYDKIRAFNEAPDTLKAQGLYFYMRKLESSSEAKIIVNGQEMLMFASNNYLGLTTHPKVKEATKKAVDRYGVGAGSARLLGGTFQLHEELEDRLARFKGVEAAIVYSSGYVSNLATLTAFLDRVTDLAIIDEHIHASLLDGLRFSRTPFRVFAHNDMNDLHEKLAASAGKGNLIVVVDGVYSMDGDIANLPAIYHLARQYQALVLIDEAHAMGVLGEHGRGTPEHYGMHGKVDIVMGTLSKALGGVGGFAAGSKEFVDYLKHYARGFIFSTALPPANCASLIAALDVLQNEPEWLIRLRENTDLMRNGLQQLGFNTGFSQTPIIPVIVGDELKAYQLARALHSLGIYVSPVAFPAVKKDSARIRLGVMATHTTADILQTLDAFKKAKEMLSIESVAA